MQPQGHKTALIGITSLAISILGFISWMIALMYQSPVTQENEAMGLVTYEISCSVIPILSAMISALLGITCILIAFWYYQNREMWFFGWSMILSSFILPIGLLVLVPFVLKRREFHHLS